MALGLLAMYPQGNNKPNSFRPGDKLEAALLRVSSAYEMWLKQRKKFPIDTTRVPAAVEGIEARLRMQQDYWEGDDRYCVVAPRRRALTYFIQTGEAMPKGKQTVRS